MMPLYKMVTGARAIPTGRRKIFRQSAMILADN